MVTREAQRRLFMIRSRLLLLPTQLARKRVGKSQHEMRMIIDAAIREMLTALSDSSCMSPASAARSARQPAPRTLRIVVLTFS